MKIFIRFSIIFYPRAGMKTEALLSAAYELSAQHFGYLDEFLQTWFFLAAFYAADICCGTLNTEGKLFLGDPFLSSEISDPHPDIDIIYVHKEPSNINFIKVIPF